VYVSDAEPVGAPRQIKRDLWKPRVGVVKYRAFKDILKLQVGPVPDAREVVKVEIVALFATPPSWRRSKRERLIYTQHQQTPDADNVGKAVLDTMWPKNDSAIAWVETQKFWADRNGLVISIWRKAGE
jgi:Holliday junction resolvase RusA-like endonuclease